MQFFESRCHLKISSGKPDIAGTLVIAYLVGCPFVKEMFCNKVRRLINGYPCIIHHVLDGFQEEIQGIGLVIGVILFDRRFCNKCFHLQVREGRRRGPRRELVKAEVYPEFCQFLF